MFFFQCFCETIRFIIASEVENHLVLSSTALPADIGGALKKIRTLGLVEQETTKWSELEPHSRILSGKKTWESKPFWCGLGPKNHSLGVTSIYSGQIIATSHDLTPNGGLVREIPLFQGNLGW